MGIDKRPWEDEVKEEHAGFRSLNVRNPVYDQIKAVAKENDRTIASTMALMVQDYFRNHKFMKSYAEMYCGKGYWENGCGCPEPCEVQEELHKEHEERWANNEIDLEDLDGKR